MDDAADMLDKKTGLDNTLDLIENLSKVESVDIHNLQTNLKYINDYVRMSKALLENERRVVEETFQTKFMVNPGGIGYWCPPSCKQS